MASSALDEYMRSINYPHRTLEQSRILVDASCYPFTHLTEEENDELFLARLNELEGVEE